MEYGIFHVPSLMPQRLLDIIANDPYDGDARIGQYAGNRVVVEKFYAEPCVWHQEGNLCLRDSDGNWGGTRKHRRAYYWQEWLWSVECSHCQLLSPLIAKGVYLGEEEPLALICPVCGYIWQLYDEIHHVKRGIVLNG